MKNLPDYISIFFIIITVIPIYFFYAASHKSKTVLIVLLGWLTIQTVIGLSGFYTITNTMPPRFLLTIVPPLLLIIILFVTPKGRLFIDGLDKKMLTLLHIVRIPVELILLGLFINKAIPQIMTFEGRNFDILSGITAPIIYYIVFKKQVQSKTALLIWNFICLGLLINIVTTAILSAPFPFQQLAFDQPNIGVLYFPFVWLPALIVPLVLFAHLVVIRQLLFREPIYLKKTAYKQTEILE
jgi:hypothetical protein